MKTLENINKEHNPEINIVKKLCKGYFLGFLNSRTVLIKNASKIPCLLRSDRWSKSITKLENRMRIKPREFRLKKE